MGDEIARPDRDDALPIWWEAFQMPQARPISRGLYQKVSSRVHGGTPTPGRGC
jgi:hypothetical protein